MKIKIEDLSKTMVVLLQQMKDAAEKAKCNGIADIDYGEGKISITVDLITTDGLNSLPRFTTSEDDGSVTTTLTGQQVSREENGLAVSRTVTDPETSTTTNTTTPQPSVERQVTGPAVTVSETTAEPSTRSQTSEETTTGNTSTSENGADTTTTENTYE